jgi:arginase
VPIIYVPYHLDAHLPDLGIPLPHGTEASTVTAELPEGDIWPRLVALYGAVADAVAAEQPAQQPAEQSVTVVSGDCTVSIGIAAGLQRAGVDPSIVWIDAHGDVQTLETTDSGYVGGMALRFLLGYRADLIADPLGLRPPSEDRVLLVDARDLDPAEVEYLDQAPVRRSTVEDLTADVLPDGPLLLNLDLDVVNPDELPGVRYPAPYGPEAAAVLQATRTILATGRVAALNIACTWNPGAVDTTKSHDLMAALLSR